MGTPPGGTIQAIAAAKQGGKRGACLFTLDDNGSLSFTTQETPGGPWQVWQGPSFGGQASPGTQLACAGQNNGRLMLVLLDYQGMVWTMEQQEPDGDWGDWQGPGIGSQKYSFQAIAAGQQSGPRGIQLFAADVMGQRWSCFQVNPGAGWSGWSNALPNFTGGPRTEGGPAWAVGEVALGGQNNGCLMLIEEGSGTLMGTAQTNPGGAWQGGTGLNPEGPQVNSICACEQGGSRGIQIWGLDAGGNVQTVFQDKAGGVFDPWQAFLADQPAPFVRIAAAGQNNGCTIFFGVTIPGELWAVAQTSPGGGWDRWHQLPVPGQTEAEPLGTEL
jgi:hypothetical protein